MSDSIPALIARVNKRIDSTGYDAPWIDDVLPLLDALESLSAPSGDDREPLMSDLIPDEERESAITEAYNTITGNGEVEWGPEATQDALEKLWDRARRVSPVTREAVKQMLAENGFTPNGGHPHSWRCEHPDRYPGACRCVDEMTDDILALLSVSPPAEVEWEYGHDCDESREVHGDDESPHNPWGPQPDCKNVTLYRRTPAGPWVPVEKGAEQ